MATNESAHAWIVTVQSEVGSDGQPHYFYRLGASDGDLVSTLRSAGFQLAPDRTLNDDRLVRVGLIYVHRRRPSDNWSIGSAPHHYYLQDADRQATIDALQGVELQHATRITDAVEGALGERWDLRRL